MIYFVLRLAHLDTVNNLFQRLDTTMVDRVQKLPYATLFEMATAPAGVYVFTGLDQISDAQREAGGQIVDALRETGSVALNHPRETLDRFALLSTLHSLGLNRFRVFRAGEFQAGKVTYPVFVRSNRQHGGPLSPLLHSELEVEGALRRARIWGHSEDDLLVVEYCHTQDQDGYFRKYSAFRIGDRIVPCYLEHGPKWSVKRLNSKPKAGAPDLADEEFRYVSTNPHRGELERIFDIARIQFGRIDYALHQGRLQTWEINTAPSFGQSGRRRNPARDREREARLQARKTFLHNISEALESLDASVKPGEAAVRYDRGLLQQIREDLRSERTFINAMRVRDVARSMGLSRLGAVKMPLSWVLARFLNRRG